MAQVDDLTAARLAEKIRQRYPHMKGGDVLSLAKSGYGPNSPQAEEIGRRRAKKKAGFGLHSFGDVARGTVRTGFTILESGFQEVQGQLRAIAAAAGEAAEEGEPLYGIPERLGGAYSKAGASTGRIAVRDFVRTGKVDLGTGYFAGGGVAREQAEQSKQLRFAGEPISTGRLLAYAVSEPGSKPYTVLSGLVDAAVMVGADPANVAGGSIAKVRHARRTFTGAAELTPTFRKAAESAGLVSGVRKTVVPEIVEGWLSGKQGEKVIDYLRGEENLRRMWTSTGKKLPVDLLVKLRDAKTSGEVIDILRPVLGTTVRDKLAVESRRFGKPRLAYSMPGAQLDLSDPGDVVERMERFMKNARLTDDQIDTHIDAIARATVEGKTPVYGAVEAVMKDVALSIGGDEKVARKATRMFGDYHRELAKYAVDEIGNNVPVLGATVDGAGRVLPTPHLFVEYLNHNLPLPDAREIRRLTASEFGVGKVNVRKIVNSPVWDGSVAAVDAVFGTIWKPLVLLRGAWTVRVVGEEQVRMGAAGLDSVFAHPLSAISWITGRKGGANVKGDVFRDLTDVTDDIDEYTNALSRRGGGWADRIVKFGRTTYARGDDDYIKSWAEELHKLRADPVARRVAGGWGNEAVPGGLTGNHVEDAKRWFFDGPGRKFREDMAQSPGREALNTIEGSNAYVDSVFERINVTTGRDARLMEAVATGTLEGQAIVQAGRLDRSVLTTLGIFADEGIGPGVVAGDLTMAARNTAMGKTADNLGKATEWLFNGLMSKPTNKLSRSPAFRQFYYKRIEELLPFADKATQESLIAGAEAAGMKVDRLRRMAARGAGDLNVDEADLIAKGWALDKTKELLYDLNEKGQFFDIYRNFFPFGEAWKEMVTRWSKLGMENPAVFNRARQTVEGARGAGFFYTDPTTQEEMFNYPGTGLVSEWMFDVRAPLQARVGGLSLMTEVIPGVGPVVQLPMSKIIPNKPEWDWVRGIVLPFGDPRTGIIPGVATPPWFDKLQKFNDTPESDRLFANTQFEVMKALVASGDYNTNSPDEVQRLLVRSQTVARQMYVMRGFAQFFAPSAPAPEIEAQDKTGRWHYLSALSTEFNRYQQQDYDTAVERFLEDFGPDLALVMQPKTQGGAPPVEGVGDFVRSNPEIRDRFPKSYGYFAPDVGDFDFDLYESQIKSGEREALSPKEATDKANARIAGTYWRKAKDLVGPSPSDEQKVVLRNLKAVLLKRYPGWSPETFDKGRIPNIVRELEVAVLDPKLKNTDAGRGIATYLKARQLASQIALNAGLEPGSWQQAKSMAQVRDVLRKIGAVLAARYSEFSRTFDEVFDREMVEEAQEVA